MFGSVSRNTQLESGCSLAAAARGKSRDGNRVIPPRHRQRWSQGTGDWSTLSISVTDNLNKYRSASKTIIKSGNLGMKYPLQKARKMQMMIGKKHWAAGAKSYHTMPKNYNMDGWIKMFLIDLRLQSFGRNYGNWSGGCFWFGSRLADSSTRSFSQSLN